MSVSTTSSRKKVKRQDVADAAGVSGAMISYAFSNNKNIRMSSKTRERICKIAEELGYSPNFSGKALVHGKSYNIGLLMPSGYASAISFHTLNITHGLSLSVEETDYNLVTFFGREEKFFRKIESGRLDGIVILESLPDYNVINKTLDTGLPTVIMNIDFDVKDQQNAACVRSDHELMVQECFKYFHHSGCKRILGINFSKDSNSDANRIIYDEFNRQCAKYACSGASCSVMVTCEKKQIRDMFASGQRWDGYYIDGSEESDIFLAVASEFGLEIDRDFRLYVSDTNTLRQNFDYPCYLHSQREIGRVAWHLLNSMLEGETLPQNKILVPYRPASELCLPGFFAIDVDRESEKTALNKIYRSKI